MAIVGYQLSWRRSIPAKPTPRLDAFPDQGDWWVRRATID